MFNIGRKKPVPKKLNDRPNGIPHPGKQATIRDSGERAEGLKTGNRRAG